MAKYCNKCGSELRLNAKFCTKCGNQIIHKVRNEELEKSMSVKLNVSKDNAKEKVVTKTQEAKKDVKKAAEEIKPRFVSLEKKTGDNPFIEGDGLGSFYIIDFAKSMTRKTNIPILIYLVLNVFVIGFIATALFQLNFVYGFLFGLILYLVSLTIALSPFGEWILRLQTGCRKIKRPEQISRIEPIFREVYAKAKQQNPSIPDDVQLFICNDDSPNAFATGRKTICVTGGLLNMPDSQIKATLGHEFGHLAHKDTDLILVVSVGNMIISAIIVGIRVIIELVHLFIGLIGVVVGGPEGIVTTIGSAISNLCISSFVAGLTWLWTKLGVVLVMKSSRGNEFEADEFSFNLGYGNALCALLDSIGGAPEKGLFANLASSHPDKDQRIARLQELGVTYRKSYGK